MSLQTFDTVLAFAAAMLVLSLFITAWVQFVSAALQLRSGNLAWGLDRLIRQIDPEGQLKDYMAPVIRQVLEHRALARDGGLFGKRAEAITADELIKALRDISVAPDTAGVRDVVKGWLESLGGAMAPADAQATVAAITAEAGKLFPAQTQALSDAIERAIQGRDALTKRVSEWFDSTMDRTSERFALQCRWVTVVGSAIVVLLMGVDSLWIFQQLNSQPELRQVLVDKGPALIDQTKAAETAKQQSCATSAGSDALHLLAGSSANPADGAKLKGAPAGLSSVADARVWLKEQDIQSVDLQELKTAQQAAAKACVEQLGKQVAESRAAIDKGVTALLLPSWWQATTSGRQPDPSGLLLSFVLLSLGAPFWFNVLKNLSSLRPLIASRSDAAR